MPSNLQAGKVAVTEQPSSAHPPVPQEWGPTVSAFSDGISLLALFVSGLAFRNTRKSARQTSFDNHYGDSIRTALRKLEDACGKLRAYSFPSKALNDLKNEVPGVQAEIEERAFKVRNLLGEVDSSNSHKCRDWAPSFQKQIEAAGLKLEAATGAAVTAEIQFRGRVADAAELYRIAIRDARAKLEKVRKKA